MSDVIAVRNSAQTLRPYQQEAIQAIREAWTDGQTPLAWLATGAGKTTILSQLLVETVDPYYQRALVEGGTPDWQEHRTRPDAFKGVPPLSNLSTPLKRCSKCREMFPATPEYFRQQKGCRDGLRPECKQCASTYGKSWYASNLESTRENQKAWYEAHKADILPKNAAYRKTNQEKMRQYRRTWREKNPDKQKIAVDRWTRANPERSRVKWHRRQARKLSLPDTLTSEQWSYALDYWRGCCAYCGEPFESKGKRRLTGDHFIPLSSAECPGTTADNILPVCLSCNAGKRDNDPVEWLTKKLGEHAATQLRGVETYFECVRGKWTR